MEKKKAFIINFLYFAFLLCAVFLLLKYGLPMLSPFVIAFVIAYLLKRPVIFLSRKLHLPRKPAAVLLVLVFYSTIGLLIFHHKGFGYESAANLRRSCGTCFDRYLRKR